MNQTKMTIAHNAIRVRYSENSGRWIVTDGNKTKRYGRDYMFNHDNDAARVVSLFVADEMNLDNVRVTGAHFGKDRYFVITG